MKRNWKFLLILMLVLFVAACARNNEEEPAADDAAATAVVADESAVDEETAVPTGEPAPAPTPEPAAAEEHDAHAEPAQEAGQPAAEPAAQRSGLLRFRDGEGARSGSYALLLPGIPPAPAGSHYELWLRDDSFNTLNLGPFEAGGDVQLSGEVEQHLLGRFSAAFVSIEADGVDDGEIGPIAFEGSVPAGSLLHIRHVIFQFPGTPDGRGFLLGADDQLAIAVEHAGFMQNELANDNLREAQRHAEHVVNVLAGDNGASAGDLDGDGVAQNPGDGFGVRAYLEGAKEHAQLAADAPDASFEVQLHAGHVIISSDNALGHLEEAISQAIRIVSSDTAAEAQPAANALAQSLDALVNGVDADGDGAVAPIPGEGGYLTAYEHALNMGSFEFFAAGGTAAAPPAPTAAAEGEHNAAGHDAAPAAGSEIVISMSDFAYDQPAVTVAVGTAVTWTNNGDKKHSATADDGSFNTGLLDPGQSGTIVFDTPGTYSYFCELHGGSGGQGMSATITVTDG